MDYFPQDNFFKAFLQNNSKIFVISLLKTVILCLTANFLIRLKVLLWARHQVHFLPIFFSHYEQKWLDNCPTKFKPMYYKCYVDHSFVLFKSKDHIIPFLNFLNSQHPCIKFTYEVESDNTLPFLDINICHSNGSFLTSVYYKPMFTGIFTNFEKFLPITYKKGLIYSLEKLRKFQKLNGYLDEFLDHCFKTLNKKISSSD